MPYPLAGHTNSYHTYSFDEALAGIAGAGFKGVELSAVPGWTEHVDLDADPGSVREKLEGYGLTAVSLSGHSDLTTREGLAHGIRAARWAGRYGLPVLNTAVGGHSVKVNYDTANVEFYSGDLAVDDLPKITGELAHVHLKDTTGGKGNWNFPGAGDGHVDFGRVLSILRDAGYSGPYSVEIEFEGEPWPPLDEVNAAMRRSYEHLSALGLE
jgi:sugar phosphate isomerase/epimerase